MVLYLIEALPPQFLPSSGSVAGYWGALHHSKCVQGLTSWMGCLSLNWMENCFLTSCLSLSDTLICWQVWHFPLSVSFYSHSHSIISSDGSGLQQFVVICIGILLLLLLLRFFKWILNWKVALQTAVSLPKLSFWGRRSRKLTDWLTDNI